MPNTIGRNSTAMTGSVRTAASSGAPDHEAPGAARQVLHHQQRQAAEHHAHPEGVRHEIRLEEALGARHDEADAGQHDADDGRPSCRSAACPTALLGRVVGFRCHVVVRP